MLALLVIAGCFAPPVQPEPYHAAPVVFVGVVGCDAEHVEIVRANVPNLDELHGPRWCMASRSTGSDVVVRCGPLAGPSLAGQYKFHTAYVVVDPAHAAPPFEFAQAVEHELIHWRLARYGHGALHLCTAYNDTPPCWNGGSGPGVMNPVLSSCPGFFACYPAPTGFPVVRPSPADVAFFAALSGP